MNRHNIITRVRSRQVIFGPSPPPHGRAFSPVALRVRRGSWKIMNIENYPVRALRFGQTFRNYPYKRGKLSPTSHPNLRIIRRGSGRRIVFDGHTHYFHLIFGPNDNPATSNRTTNSCEAEWFISYAGSEYIYILLWCTRTHTIK